MPVPASAIMRIAYDTANTPAARLLACRRVAASWLVKAPMARNIAALAVTAVAWNNDAETEMLMLDRSPLTTVNAAVNVHSTAKPVASPAVAWIVALRREV